jgi:hypothetical protein
MQTSALSPLTACSRLGDSGGSFGASRTLAPDDFDLERLRRYFLRCVAACNVSHDLRATQQLKHLTNLMRACRS